MTPPDRRRHDARSSPPSSPCVVAALRRPIGAGPDRPEGDPHRRPRLDRDGQERPPRCHARWHGRRSPCRVPAARRPDQARRHDRGGRPRHRRRRGQGHVRRAGALQPDRRGRSSSMGRRTSRRRSRARSTRSWTSVRRSPIDPSDTGGMHRRPRRLPPHAGTRPGQGRRRRLRLDPVLHGHGRPHRRRARGARRLARRRCPACPSTSAGASLAVDRRASRRTYRTTWPG